MTEINGAEIEAVDVITFGSPCQDLSVAGKRAGLKHSANGDDETTRSGLFMEAVRIIKEMRRATHGEYPKFICWENVPGAFSSNKGEDFRTVLEELVRIVEPEAPPIPSPGKAGWPYADCIVGDGWSLAWRVFDAQYWPGTPQRRRRIYLVLDLTGGCAEKVLFERPGLRGYSEESGTPWEGASEDPQDRSRTDDSESGCLTPWDVQSRRIFTANRSWPSLYGGEGGGHGYVCYGAEPVAVATQQGGAEISENGICPTITAAAGMSGNNQPWTVYGVVSKGNGDTFLAEERHTTLSSGGGQPGQGYPCVMQPITPYGISSYDSHGMKSSNPHAGIYEAVTSRTLDLNGGNPACNQGGIAIVEPVDFVTVAAGFSTEHSAKARSVGFQEEVSPTLRAGTVPAAVYDARGNGDGQTANTITGDHNGHISDYTALACYCMAHGQANAEICENISPTLSCNHEQPIIFDKEVYNSGANATGGHYISEGGPAPTLRGTGHAPGVCDQYIVRRLTPTECARLQGFPDRWGDIPLKDSLTDDEYSFWLSVRNTHAAINGRATKEYTKDQILKWYNKLHSDSAEYKMWGNGIALPNALYVMQGIAEAVNT